MTSTDKLFAVLAVIMAVAAVAIRTGSSWPLFWGLMIIGCVVSSGSGGNDE